MNSKQIFFRKNPQLPNTHKERAAACSRAPFVCLSLLRCFLKNICLLFIICLLFQTIFQLTASNFDRFFRLMCQAEFSSLENRIFPQPRSRCVNWGGRRGSRKIPEDSEGGRGRSHLNTPTDRGVRSKGGGRGGGLRKIPEDWRGESIFQASKFALQGLIHEPKKSIEIQGRELKYCLK